ncbi:UbiA family prenyltransferase [Flavobacterium sp. DG1-102-2]|uniref:UbiA family prenyltransferase n=1 Tax=Flavobacterium sp. DG1-102-2 TaxID=3081663 RepID=UPI00294A951C|nr:UbiA family prenyltransferase [Flavobacterium sp. DG1-102-2]MDV6166970.1 UbiA family prenyltransferase [Flavobacterium sp. DG1-102-2]
MKFLKLIGFENLVILAFAQLIFKYGFLDLQPGLTLTLNSANYALLVLASVLIGAGGFLITNITAKGSQAYGLSESVAYYIYGAFTIGGLIIGYYLSDLIGRTSFLMAFAIPVATLYFYSTNLRQSLLLGNVAIAIVTGISIMIIGFFAVYPVFGNVDPVRLSTIFGLIRDYAVFALIAGFLTTLLNDLKNPDGDYNEGLNTLPIAIGRDRAAKVAFGVGLVLVALLLYYANTYLKELLLSLGYGLLFVLGPIIYILINLWTAKTHKEFAMLEIVMKAVLFFTAASIAVISYNIHYHA